MDVILAGTGETVDLPLIIFGLALLFGLLFFALWFPAWRRQQLRERKEAEYMETYLENTGMSPEAGTTGGTAASGIEDEEIHVDGADGDDSNVT